jgi:hypothetical protein
VFWRYVNLPSLAGLRTELFPILSSTSIRFWTWVIIPKKELATDNYKIEMPALAGFNPRSLVAAIG